MRCIAVDRRIFVRSRLGVMVGALCTAALISGCTGDGNRTIRPGTQDYQLFPPPTEPAVTATGPIPMHQAALETTSFAPSVNDEAQMNQLIDQAEGRLFEDDPTGAIDLLSEARAIYGWAQSRHAPRLLFWLGHAYDQLDERVAAASAYLQLVMRYPDSGSAKRARERLRNLEDDGE